MHKNPRASRYIKIGYMIKILLTAFFDEFWCICRMCGMPRWDSTGDMPKVTILPLASVYVELVSCYRSSNRVTLLCNS